MKSIVPPHCEIKFGMMSLLVCAFALGPVVATWAETEAVGKEVTAELTAPPANDIKFIDVHVHADLSGHVVPGVLKRDLEFAREFCIRHQDKLLFETDEGWWSFSKDPSPFEHFTFFESLNLPDAVRHKIYRGNAEKLFGWTKE